MNTLIMQNGRKHAVHEHRNNKIPIMRESKEKNTQAPKKSEKKKEKQ